MNPVFIKNYLNSSRINKHISILLRLIKIALIISNVLSFMLIGFIVLIEDKPDYSGENIFHAIAFIVAFLSLGFILYGLIPSFFLLLIIAFYNKRKNLPAWSSIRKEIRLVLLNLLLIGVTAIIGYAKYNPPVKYANQTSLFYLYI